MTLARYTLVLSLLCGITIHKLDGQLVEKSMIACADSSDKVFSYTTGRSVTSSMRIYVSPGFQQLPFPVEDMNVSSASDISFQLDFQPNQKYLTIEGEQLVPSDVDLVIYDLDGKEMYIPYTISNGITLDFNQQNSGIYYLVLEDYKRKQVASFKIVISQ